MDTKIILALLCFPCVAYGFGYGSQCTVEFFLGYILGNSLDGDNFGLFGTHTKRECPAGFVELKTGCYAFVEEERTWFEARIDCQVRGGHLVIVNKQKENDAIKTYLTANGDREDYWMGLNDILVLNTLMWDTKNKPLSSTDFTDFSPGEPNTDSSRCIRFANNFSYQWGDQRCDRKFRYVCERRKDTKFKCNSW